MIINKFFPEIIVISYSFSRGGAAIAANKMANLLAIMGLKVRYINAENEGILFFFKRLLSYFITKLQFDDNPTKHSLNLFSSSKLLTSLKNCKKTLFHFHWINNDTLSVFDFDLIHPGSIITLHDEWLYCGSEHYYKFNDPELDFIRGYRRFKSGHIGLNLNFYLWNIKLCKFKDRHDLIFTVPSRWMLERAKSSIVLNELDIRLLPNPIDTNNFSSSTPKIANDLRAELGFSKDDILICFGAINLPNNYLKGGDLLFAALEILHQSLPFEIAMKVRLIEFGGSGFVNTKFTSLSVGYISDIDKLSLLYSAVDFVIVPSLVEAFGQIAAESLACETPVVCFRTSGLLDIVSDGFSGFISDELTPECLAKSIKRMILVGKEERRILGENGRKHIIENFSYEVIMKKYSTILIDASKILTDAL